MRRFRNNSLALGRLACCSQWAIRAGGGGGGGGLAQGNKDISKKNLLARVYLPVDRYQPTGWTMGKTGP